MLGVLSVNIGDEWIRATFLTSDLFEVRFRVFIVLYVCKTLSHRTSLLFIVLRHMPKWIVPTDHPTSDGWLAIRVFVSPGVGG